MYEGIRESPNPLNPAASLSGALSSIFPCLTPSSVRSNIFRTSMGEKMIDEEEDDNNDSDSEKWRQWQSCVRIQPRRWFGQIRMRVFSTSVLETNSTYVGIRRTENDTISPPTHFTNIWYHGTVGFFFIWSSRFILKINFVKFLKGGTQSLNLYLMIVINKAWYKWK